MTIAVRQHVPGWASIEPREVVVETVADLLAVPWIASWATAPTFYRFTLSDYRYVMASADWGGRLMAELEAGFVWWVIAHVRGDRIDALPEWKARYR
jgi:hypothetical protein